MIRRLARGLGVAALYVAAYHALSLRIADPYKMPTLDRMFGAARDLARDGTLWKDLMISSERIGAGLLAGALGAVLAVVVVSIHPWVRAVVEPGLRLLRAVPAIALVPVAILALGLNFAAQALIIALACMLPMWVTFQEAGDSWTTRYGPLASSLGLGTRERWIRVQFPLIGSTLAQALRIGCGIACYALVASELLGADAGLMYRANLSYDAGKMANMYVSLLVLAFLCLALDAVIDRLRSRARPTEVVGA